MPGIRFYPLHIAVRCLLLSITLVGPILVTGQSLFTPQNKNFLIEKGTGHVCGSCPDITLRCDSVIDSHPGRGMLIEYHFGPDAVPQAPPLDYDYTTPYGDTIYDPAKLGWPFYLNMMVNRRDQGFPWGSTFIFGPTNQVQDEADTVVTQPSPVNIHMSSVFDSTTRLLTVNVQAYYTASSATQKNFIQVVLTEDSIISMQDDPFYPLNNHLNPSFAHMNVFRDNLNGFGGDTVFSTVQGTLVSRTYTYTIPAFYKNIPCDPNHCNLTVYIAEESAASGVQSFTGKIITAIRAHIGQGTPTGIHELSYASSLSVYPNPASHSIYVHYKGNTNYSVEMTDMEGRIVYRETGITYPLAAIDISNMPDGLYFMRVIDRSSTTYTRILVAK